MRIARGATRTVIVTRRWALKFPGRWRDVHEGRWRSFLRGLISNMQEASMHGLSDSLCPVVFSVPGGFLNVMPAVERTLNSDELFQLLCGELDGFEFEERLTDVVKLFDPNGLELPGEPKPTSFGWLHGRIVMVDYGD